MNRLRELRREKKVSQKELGEMFSAAQNTVSQWETGTREMDFSTAIAMADFFNCSVDYLLGRTEEKNKKPIREDELSGVLVEMLRSLDSDEIRRVQDFVAGMKAARKE